MKLPTLENNLLGDITGIAHAAAVKSYSDNKNGTTVRYVSDIIGDKQVGAVISAARQRVQSQGKGGFQPIVDAVAGLEDDKLHQLSRMGALYALVASAVSSAERAASLPAPKERIKEFLNDYLTKAPDKTKAVAQLSGKLDGLIISLTHTMHPTIYHTPEARKFEADLIKILENEKNYEAAVPLRSSRSKLKTEGRSEVQALCEKFIADLASGKAHISPKRPMTVSIETREEKKNLKTIRKELSSVAAAWNEAVAELGLPALTIDDARKQKMFEFRTWGQSADADGREKSTSQFLYECIQENLENGVYKGATLDLRQNANKVHRPFMDALVDIAYRNSNKERYAEKQNFSEFCKAFLEKRWQTYKVADPKNFRFTMLNGFNPAKSEALDDRTEFLTEIIRQDYKLIPKQLGIDAIAFNSGEDKTPPPAGLPYTAASDAEKVQDKGVRALLQAFKNRYKEHIEQAKYDPATIQYMEMGDVTIPYDLNKSDGVKVSMRGAWDAVLKLNGWLLESNGTKYTRLFPPTPNKEPILDFWCHVNPDQIRVQNFLQGVHMLAKNSKQIEEIRAKGGQLNVKAHYKPISLEDRATLTDTAKRLFVIKDAIEKYGEKVATRYQIANFSEPADFMILLKLFQDTGIAEIENGIVKSSKLAVMPLLETGEDLRAAPEIFRRLLENPVAKSFWKARGNEVEIMIGHSDGGASVGNFASEWEIYQATRKLTQLFEAEGMNVRFFHGRGRGVNRGGTIDPSLHAKLLSPEETKRGIYDVTIQSDLPTDLAASESYGKDYFTKILLSTLDAAITAPQRIADAERLAPLEQAIGGIAKNSGELYEEFVRNNPEALKLLLNASDNPNKTSRLASRESKEETTFDDVRAIPKEYLFNLIDLPVHNIGLRQSMDEYEARAGNPPLADLKQHPFFDSIIKMVGSGMANYDPEVARAHAKITQSESFVEPAILQLDGLPRKLARLTFDEDSVQKVLENNRPRFSAINAARAQKNEPRLINQVDYSPPVWIRALDQIGHGIIIDSIGRRGKPAKPNKDDEPQWIDTLYNALFINSEGIRNAQMPWRAREPEWAMTA